MTQFLISIMDITPLSDSLSGDKALYDKAFKLVPGYRQQKICNLKNDDANFSYALANGKNFQSISAEANTLLSNIGKKSEYFYFDKRKESCSFL